MLLSKKGFTTIGTLLAMMLSMPIISSVLMKQRTADLIYTNIEEVEEKNVALVLGAAAYPNGLSDILRDRMDSAIELYNAEKVQKLIMSGAPNEVEKMVEYALENGVEENDLIEDVKGLNTFASIQNASQISEIIIITQRYHLPRALFLANYFGIDAIGFASDKSTYEKMFEFKKREIFASSKTMWYILSSK